MEKKKILKKLAVLLLIPLSTFLIQFSSKRPTEVERLYSNGIYPPIARALSNATGVLPFSAAELIVLAVSAALIIYTASLIIKAFSRRANHSMLFLNYFTNILVIVSIGLFSFLSLWGMNYYRMPFSSIAGLEVSPASVEELESLCSSLIVRANDLRSAASIDAAGNFDMPESRRDILNNCFRGYEALAVKYPELAGSYGNPKPVMLSKLMNYTGICGVYFPFTGEANVNVSIPEVSIPSTASHEMAHQRGFSREDEANYISYLACTAHPDLNYKYSGVLLALINSMNALYENDQSAFYKLSESYSQGVRHDFQELNRFWAQYEGPVERTSDRINNAYLKANNQSDGVKSYGRMVDLLIAEHRLAKKR